MLFWSFVLAFVLSILYYISPTHNVVQVEEKPVSDALVATFVNAHQAAKRWTYTNTDGLKTINQQCETTDDAGNKTMTNCLDDDGNVISIQVADPSQRVITFTYQQNMQNLKAGMDSCSGSVTSGFLSAECVAADDASKKDSLGGLAYIDPDFVEQFLPGAGNKFDALNITSAIACISNTSSNMIYDEAGNATGEYETTTPYLTFDCNGAKAGGVGDYVITYMQAPDTDKSYITRNELWRSGILRRTKGSHECGVLWKTRRPGDSSEDRYIDLRVYTYNADGDVVASDQVIQVGNRIKYDANSDYILDNSRRFTLSVPQVIGNVLSTSEALKNDMESGYLLFCITPVDDIQKSFEFKCDRGYGKYKIVDGTGSVTRTPEDCSK